MKHHHKLKKGAPFWVPEMKPGIFVRHKAGNMIGILRKVYPDWRGKVFWLNGMGKYGGTESRLPLTDLREMEELRVSSQEKVS